MDSTKGRHSGVVIAENQHLKNHLAKQKENQCETHNRQKMKRMHLPSVSFDKYPSQKNTLLNWQHGQGQVAWFPNSSHRGSESSTVCKFPVPVPTGLHNQKANMQWGVDGSMQSKTVQISQRNTGPDFLLRVITK